ncbi:MAG: hypothetical protein M3139_13125 [Bacteroidota bacterium]|nr:hypothetical protein [Bacteroidota bacterium]
MIKEFYGNFKKKVIESINAMPEEEFIDIDILLEQIIILNKIEKAEKDISEGKVYTTEEAKQRLSKWLQ